MIIETDCGHDADDAFTICYLVAAGVKPSTIFVTPGDLDQIATVRFLCDELNLKIPIGYSKKSEKLSSGSVHHDILKKYGKPLTAEGDDFGCNIQSEGDWFIIGPPKSLGQKDNYPDKMTMQGGFLPYKFGNPKIRLEKFENLDWCPSFNPNGAVKETQKLAAAPIKTKRFCGKNVCHSVLFDKTHLAPLKPNSRAAEIFVELAELYFQKHENKKFHDPVAAVCHLHPEIGTWIKGNPVRTKNGWTTELDETGSFILVDLDYNQFWERIYTFS